MSRGLKTFFVLEYRRVEDEARIRGPVTVAPAKRVRAGANARESENDIARILEELRGDWKNDISAEQRLINSVARRNIRGESTRNATMDSSSHCPGLYV